MRIFPMENVISEKPPLRIDNEYQEDDDISFIPLFVGLIFIFFIFEEKFEEKFEWMYVYYSQTVYAIYSIGIY